MNARLSRMRGSVAARQASAPPALNPRMPTRSGRTPGKLPAAITAATTASASSGSSVYLRRASAPRWRHLPACPRRPRARDSVLLATCASRSPRHIRARGNLIIPWIVAVLGIGKANGSACGGMAEPSATANSPSLREEKGGRSAGHVTTSRIVRRHGLRRDGQTRPVRLHQLQLRRGEVVDLPVTAFDDKLERNVQRDCEAARRVLHLEGGVERGGRR